MLGQAESPSARRRRRQRLGPFLCWAVVFADIGTSVYCTSWNSLWAARHQGGALRCNDPGGIRFAGGQVHGGHGSLPRRRRAVTFGARAFHRAFVGIPRPPLTPTQVPAASRYGLSGAPSRTRQYPRPFSVISLHQA